MGGQFFAAFRLVVHTQEGECVERRLAFVQGEFVFTSFLCLLCGSRFLTLSLVLAFTLMYVWVCWTLDGLEVRFAPSPSCRGTSFDDHVVFALLRARFVLSA